MIRLSSRCRHCETALTRRSPLGAEFQRHHAAVARAPRIAAPGDAAAVTSRSASLVTVDASKPRARATREDRARPLPRHRPASGTGAG